MGKRGNNGNRRVARVGDLNDYFFGDQGFKSHFLELMYIAFNYDMEIYFVPEVNSGTADLVSIVEDLRAAEFVFL